MANYNNPNYLQQPQLMNGISGQPQLQNKIFSKLENLS